jgi:peptidoglycan-associated lipoprotein
MIYYLMNNKIQRRVSMRLTKYAFLLSTCFCISMLTGCAWFRGENSKTPADQNQSSMQSDDMLPGMGDNSGNIVMDLGSSAETLSARPTKDWKPIGNNKVIVYFAFDQSTVGTAQIPQLEAVAKYLKSHNDIGLLVQGNCDERGSHEYNIGLGERRALAVRNYLVNIGVPDSHIQTISYGSERPANPGHNERAYSKNRRAELIPAKM